VFSCIRPKIDVIWTSIGVTNSEWYNGKQDVAELLKTHHYKTRGKRITPIYFIASRVIFIQQDPRSILKALP